MPDPATERAVDEVAGRGGAHDQLPGPELDADLRALGLAQRDDERFHDRPPGTNAPIRNQTPRITRTHGQYVAMSSPGPVPSDPGRAREQEAPDDHPRHRPGQPPEATRPARGRRRGPRRRTATPTRIRNSGHASLQVQPIARWTRKTMPRPISQVAPMIGPRRGPFTTPPPDGPAVSRPRPSAVSSTIDAQGDEHRRPEPVEVDLGHPLTDEEEDPEQQQEPAGDQTRPSRPPFVRRSARRAARAARRADRGVGWTQPVVGAPSAVSAAAPARRSRPAAGG